MMIAVSRRTISCSEILRIFGNNTYKRGLQIAVLQAEEEWDLFQRSTFTSLITIKIDVTVMDGCYL